MNRERLALRILDAVKARPQISVEELRTEFGLADHESFYVWQLAASFKHKGSAWFLARVNNLLEAR